MSLFAPDNLIELNINHPPHTIEFYRNMMCAYLGIMGEVIRNVDEKSKDVLRYAQTTKGKTRLSKSFYGKSSEPYLSFTYELVDVSHDCWTPGCAGTYFIFKINPSEYIIVFNIGHRERIASTELTSNNIQHLIKFVGKILGLLFSGAEKIVLCGHSNGMVSATFTSVLLMCLSDYAFAYEFAQRGILKNEIYNDVYKYYDPSLFFGITDKLCVCGTAGYPILFNEPQLFEYYFNALKGRYLHIGLGLKDHLNLPVELWVDYHMRPQSREPIFVFGGMYKSATPIHNYMYHIYSYPYGYFLDTVHIKKSMFDLQRNGHVLHARPEFVDYDGLNRENTLFFENEYESELHMFNFYRALLSPVFCLKQT